MTRQISKITLLFLFAFNVFCWAQQSVITVPGYLKMSADEATSIKILTALDGFYTEISEGRVDNQYLNDEHRALTVANLYRFYDYEAGKDSIAKTINDKTLVNFYTLEDHKYSLTISFIKPTRAGDTALYYLLELIATVKEDGVVFSLPLATATADWQQKMIGKTTYVYRNEIVGERAELFDAKNEKIAAFYDQSAQPLTVFMCANYNEISDLLGLKYDVYANGNFRDGYGVVGNTIFSVMNNEDFSHDIVHFYSEITYEWASRNRTVEEGFAYFLGNGYYTNSEGEMVEYNEMKMALGKYLSENPNTAVLSLLKEDPRILSNLAPEISTKSAIIAVILEQIMNTAGKEGVKTLLTSGRENQLDTFLLLLESDFGWNKENFNQKFTASLK